MNQYQKTTDELKAALLLRLALKNEIVTFDRQIEIVDLTLTPLEGWPGKNEGERSLAKQRAFADSITRCEMVAKRLEKEIERELLDAKIENLRLDLDTLKWMIRDQANNALGAGTVLEEISDNAAEIANMTAGNLSPAEQAIEELDAEAYPIPGDSAWQPDDVKPSTVSHPGTDELPF